ncbi:hypothetical protein IWQ60_000772 [Tieghemiomyces parasiticus]|uniref:Transcription factor IIIC putative zinc-finger domain-containing protein n=1 Tax=Tieghemiomyces parasiticus TaxID=78921 RepID=A0A9W8AFE7_9FUNG|nr:hypothetical protein IWQ60_000772 [Tieghemiomyces parasiticus]
MFRCHSTAPVVDNLRWSRHNRISTMTAKMALVLTPHVEEQEAPTACRFSQQSIHHPPLAPTTLDGTSLDRKLILDNESSFRALAWSPYSATYNGKAFLNLHACQKAVSPLRRLGLAVALASGRIEVFRVCYRPGADTLHYPDEEPAKWYTLDLTEPLPSVAPLLQFFVHHEHLTLLTATIGCVVAVSFGLIYDPDWFGTLSDSLFLMGDAERIVDHVDVLTLDGEITSLSVSGFPANTGPPFCVREDEVRSAQLHKALTPHIAAAFTYYRNLALREYQGAGKAGDGEGDEADEEDGADEDADMEIKAEDGIGEEGAEKRGQPAYRVQFAGGALSPGERYMAVSLMMWGPNQTYITDRIRASYVLLIPLQPTAATATSALEDIPRLLEEDQAQAAANEYRFFDPLEALVDAHRRAPELAGPSLVEPLQKALASRGPPSVTDADLIGSFDQEREETSTISTEKEQAGKISWLATALEPASSQAHTFIEDYWLRFTLQLLAWYLKHLPPDAALGASTKVWLARALLKCPKEGPAAADWLPFVTAVRIQLTRRVKCEGDIPDADVDAELTRWLALEKCPFCTEPVDQGPDLSGCRNGHHWIRCYLTYQLLATPLSRTCTTCEAKYREPMVPTADSESDLPNWVLQTIQSCVRCGSLLYQKLG